MLGNINILETCNKYTHREHACSWKFPDDAKRYDRARIYDGNYDGEVSIDRTKMNEEKCKQRDLILVSKINSTRIPFFLIRLILILYIYISLFKNLFERCEPPSRFFISIYMRVCTISKLIIIGLLHSMIHERERWCFDTDRCSCFCRILYCTIGARR